MDALELARWQFGITTVYHFIFVPLTIGLAPLVALMQTFWVRTGDERWLRLTKFFGKLLLINFAIGVATGIVQEFQFGMNWSEYSRFVGDVFGAPLAMEALAAFFVESTFLGLWIFGWDRLPKRVHLACVWAVAIATNLSAYFILAANSWMQHPVGAEYNATTGRAEMVDIGAVLSNPTLLAAFPHTISAAFLTAGTFVAGIAAWWMVRAARAGKALNASTLYRPAVILGVVTMLVSGVGVALTGDQQAKLMFDQQPMKMSSAEALCQGENGADFSLLAIGDLSNSCADVNHVLAVPGLTSFLASGDFGSYLPGVDQLQQRSEELYGAGVDYRPNLALTYWSFRLMIGLGVGSAALALVALWYLRKRAEVPRWFGTLGLVALPTPFLASAFGWIFTEMGRQPWVVAPNPNPSGVDGVWMLTAHGVSTVVSPAMVITSMVAFTLLYAALAVVWGRLMVRYASHGAADTEPDVSPDNDASGDRPLSFAY
ncbi:MAG TPA: cytochrome ubiquinol oxidase subunit I [Actinotalea sp.]